MLTRFAFAQAEDMMFNLGCNVQRYVQAPACEQQWRWAIRDDEDVNDAMDLLENQGIPRTELVIYPRGYISPLLVDQPCFLAKSLFLIQGEVRFRDSRTRCANAERERDNANALCCRWTYCIGMKHLTK